MEEKRAPSSSPRLESYLPALQFSAGASSQSSTAKWQSFSSKVWSSRWLLLALTVSFTLIALMLGAVRPPLYKCQTLIEVQAAGNGYQKSKAEEPNVATSAESYLQTQIRIVQSRSLVERVLAKLSNADRSRLVESPRFWNRPSNEQSIDSILNRISAHPSEQAGIFDISFISPDPIAGVHFLNSLASELAAYDVERSWRAAQRNREWTDKQLDDLRRKWEQSEQVLAEYSESQGLGVSRRNAENQAQDASAQRVIRRKAAGKSLPTSQATSENSDPKLRQLKSRLAEINKEITTWQTLYGPTTSTVSKLRSEAASTESSIRERRSRILANLSSAPQAQTFETVDTADRPPPQNYARIDSVPDRAQARAHLAGLQQEADSNRQVYENTASRLKEASIAGASHPGDISVVDPAVPSFKSISPSQFRNGTLGALLGFVAGLVFVTVRDHFSHTFSEPQFLSQYLGLDVMGAIPANRFYPADAAKSEDDPELTLRFDMDPKTAEAYRSIRSSILLGPGHRAGARRLVFTSAKASEGKTSVVGNLGAALASAQRRVLLVDGDLRNPGLHKFFGTDNDHGLTDLLTRQLEADPVAARDVIRETQIPDLYFLSAGQAGLRAPEILSSAQLPHLIREFAKGFDIVLIDSPPVLPYADARSLARAADAVILIVKAGSTDRRAALIARDAISQDGACIIGAILTEWDSSKSTSMARLD